MDVALFTLTTLLVTVREQQQRRNKKEQNSSSSSSSDQVLDANELVCTVDQDNQPTKTGHLRYQVRKMNLWHRATYILVRHHQTTSTTSPSAVVLVQKRSMRKDYYPGALDPTPGGVVGFGESYLENAQRELEEMGIDTTSGNPQGNSIERLFTFSFENDSVKVWGEMFEAKYTGDLKQLKLQSEEVEKVLPITLDDLQTQIETQPESFMPDSVHAVKLYLQRQADQRSKRKLLKGYSAESFDRYSLRPKPSVIFFDCDDTLYFDGWKTANHLTEKIEAWCTEKAGLPPGKAYELYKEYGTALRGLLAEGYIQDTEEAIDTFLEEVHDLPIHELLKPDPKLRELLLKIDPSVKKYIFTASVSHHAERCLKALGIEDLFEDVIIDVKQCKLNTKHSEISFNEAMKIAGVENPEECVFLDDSLTNIKAARDIGWRSILVGRVGRDCGKPISSDHAENEIDRIHEMESALPELFNGMN